MSNITWRSDFPESKTKSSSEARTQPGLTRAQHATDMRWIHSSAGSFHLDSLRGQPGSLLPLPSAFFLKTRGNTSASHNLWPQMPFLAPWALAIVLWKDMPVARKSPNLSHLATNKAQTGLGSKQNLSL